MADAGEGDIEDTVREAREFQAPFDDMKQFSADRHRCLRRQCVDTRQLAVGAERAHQVVDVVHLVHHGRHGGGTVLSVIRPQLDPDPRAHDGFLATHPGAFVAQRQFHGILHRGAHAHEPGSSMCG